jgi:uncharacterized protein YceK
MKHFPVLFFILILALLFSGCATVRWVTRHELPKDASEDYVRGYSEGRHAAEKAPDALIASMFAEHAYGKEYAPVFVYFSVPPALPPKVSQSIAGESKEYQRGFTSGWLREVRRTAELLNCIDTVTFLGVGWIIRRAME